MTWWWYAVPSNSLGRAIRITTFGESHGTMMGVIMDGLPSGLRITPEDINQELLLRSPGRRLTSARKEDDTAEIVSGLFNGRTTGSPLAMLVRNVDVKSEPYELTRYTPRPGHADLPYILKYGFENWDYRGGGRSSARETVNWVAAGAVAKKLLCSLGIRVAACLKSLGMNEFPIGTFDDCFQSRNRPFRTPGETFEAIVERSLIEAIKHKDSIGGTVRVMAEGLPPGIGDPVFSKLKADLAKAVMSTPGSTFFEMGDGISVSRKTGSEVMDSIRMKDGKYTWQKNLHGGILGGISTGDLVFFNAGFKPTSSIDREHETIDIRTNEPTTIRIIGRHDPAIVIRAVSVLEGITSVVLADHLMNEGYIPRIITGDLADKIEENWTRYTLPQLKAEHDH